MKKGLLLVVGLTLSTIGLFSQGKPVIVVQPFSVAAGVTFDRGHTKLMQTQLVAEFKAMLGKEFDIVAETPATPQGMIYTLDIEITGGHGFGGVDDFVRKVTDVQYRVTDNFGKKALERKESVVGLYDLASSQLEIRRLAHSIAQQIAKRIKDVKLK